MKEDLKTIFARRLREELARNGLSENAFARLSGVGSATINRLKNGQQDPTLHIVEGVAKGLQVPAWYLLLDKEQCEVRIYRPPVVAVPRSKA